MNFDDLRRRMVERQIAARGVNDPRVLDAMAAVPRHAFVTPEHLDAAYEDRPLPIGYSQTISQPYIVAYMVEQLRLPAAARVLEIGTGCGYQTAVLAHIAQHVWSIEIVAALADRARATLGALGIETVTIRAGDGYGGWPDAAPFDGIVLAAAPDHVPPALADQLAVGGRLVLPVGAGEQELRVLTRTGDGTTEDRLLPVRFVPLVSRSPERP